MSHKVAQGRTSPVGFWLTKDARPRDDFNRVITFKSEVG